MTYLIALKAINSPLALISYESFQTLTIYVVEATQRYENAKQNWYILDSKFIKQQTRQ